VGRKIGIKAAISKDTISYLQCFWSTIGIMTIENSQLFQTSVQGFSFWMRHGKEFCVGNSVVVELNEPYEGHMWTWKAKITQFFIHEFYGDRRVFFQGKYYNTATSASSSFVALQNSCTGMVVLQPHPQ
jgi:hypothetical protein